MEKEDLQQRNDIIAGRNPVSEALRSGRAIDSILIARGSRTGSIVGIAAKAEKAGIPVKEADVKKLDFMCGGAVHQGIIAVACAKEYVSVEEILAVAQSRDEPPFIVVLDEIEDPHNLGAIIRSAECAGAHGVIIKKRHSAGLTYTVDKASAGALSYMAVARVTNISSAIDELKERGVWVYGADMGGEDYTKCDYSGAKALVVGNEGKGISRLVKEKCDRIISLPLNGKIGSLNASVAAGILMYQMIR